MGWIIFPPQNHMLNPDLQNLGMWTYLEIKSLQMKLVKWGQTGGGQAPNLTGVLIKKKKFGHRDGHEERHHLNVKADTQVMLLSRGLPADHQKLERGLDGREMHPAHTGIDPGTNTGYVTVLMVNTLQHEYLNSGNLVPKPMFLTSTPHSSWKRSRKSIQGKKKGGHEAHGWDCNRQKSGLLLFGEEIRND